MNIYSNDLTYEQVRELFDYEDGELIWKTSYGTAKAGNIAGAITSGRSGGYKAVGINYKKYKLHRLIWLWHYGSWPENQLDHINRIRTDNRIENLRLANDLLQAQNRKIKSTNKSGHTGVYWHKGHGKWCSCIGINKKQISLGNYEQYEDACKAYDEAKLKYHEF